MIHDTMRDLPPDAFAIEYMRAEARDSLNTIYWSYAGAAKIGIPPSVVKQRKDVRNAWLIFNFAADELDRLGGD